MLLLGIISLVQDFVKSHAILVGLIMQPVQVSLNSGSSVCSDYLFSPFGVICKLGEDGFHLLVQVICKNTE